jgi:hypothetical protein
MERAKRTGQISREGRGEIAMSYLVVIARSVSCSMSLRLASLSTSLRGAMATKQSNLSLRRAMDCFASLAMTG